MIFYFKNFVSCQYTMISDIIDNYIKTNSFSFFDKTNEIKTCAEYDIWRKSIKYDKDIFFIDLSKIDNDLAWYIITILEIGERNIKSSIYFNKYNKLVIKHNEQITLKALSSFLDTISNDDIVKECNICFNDLSQRICLSCPRCDFMYCKSCIKKIKKTDKRISCVACKYQVLNYKNMNTKI